MLLQNRVALVTGGARGIGAGIVRSLAREGADIAINYYSSRDAAEELRGRCIEVGVKAEVYRCDVRDEVEVQEMISSIHSDFGRLDAVINNAISGVQYAYLDEVTWEDYATAFDFGAKAVLNTVHFARPIMKQQGGGRIINIVTESWNTAGEAWTVYLAGKGAMVGISRSLAAELGPDNITVNMVSPSWMRTEKVTEDTDTSGLISTTPLGRQGDAEEIGNACAFLMSDLASYISGAFIPVSGGRVRQMGN